MSNEFAYNMGLLSIDHTEAMIDAYNKDDMSKLSYVALDLICQGYMGMIGFGLGGPLGAIIGSRLGHSFVTLSDDLRQYQFKRIGIEYIQENSDNLRKLGYKKGCEEAFKWYKKNLRGISISKEEFRTFENLLKEYLSEDSKDYS